MLPEFDKYAPYVWVCYGLAVVVLGGLIVWSVMRLKSAQKKIDQIENANSEDAS